MASFVIHMDRLQPWSADRENVAAQSDAMAKLIASALLALMSACCTTARSLQQGVIANFTSCTLYSWINSSQVEHASFLILSYILSQDERFLLVFRCQLRRHSVR